VVKPEICVKKEPKQKEDVLKALKLIMEYENYDKKKLKFLQADYEISGKTLSSELL